MRISDWSSDVCSSDLRWARSVTVKACSGGAALPPFADCDRSADILRSPRLRTIASGISLVMNAIIARSEEHTSELQSLMRISYAVFCLKKKTKQQYKYNTQNQQVNNKYTHTRAKI